MKEDGETVGFFSPKKVTVIDLPQISKIRQIPSKNSYQKNYILTQIYNEISAYTDSNTIANIFFAKMKILSYLLGEKIQ